MRPPAWDRIYIYITALLQSETETHVYQSPTRRYDDHAHHAPHELGFELAYIFTIFIG